MRRTLLALVLLAPLLSCSNLQWQRFKAKSAGAIVAVVFGAASVVTGGIGGLALAGAGVVLGVTVDQALEPDRETETVEVTHVVQVPPPHADGSPAQPRVDTFVTKGGGVRGNLKLPAPVGFPPPIVEELTRWERIRRALAVASWVVLGLMSLVAALSNDRLRGWLFGAIAGGVRGGARAAGDLMSRLRQARGPGATKGRRRR